MTGGDDDIAAALPRPPFPAPARREAAIAEALRRFDGGEARPAPARDGRRPALWARPYAGALAGALLVALIGLPLAWTAFDDYSDRSRERRPAVESAGPARADADPSAASTPAMKAPPAAAEKPRLPAEPERAEPPSPPAGAADRPSAGEAPAEDSGAQQDEAVVVTGTRIRHPNLESSVPVTSVGSEEIGLSERQASRAARRGDWNACTVEDPGRSPERCRSSVDTVARGARGRASEPLADGLAKAWTGDLDGAMAAFDRAIELSPRSSSAWLNRALAWRRQGDLDRALADLDRAVLYAPNDARAYYHRSLVLRQRGDRRRARADEQRAVELDPRYAPLVRSR
ncbi:MAG TPA: tetratricopeptide repeat protein [Allosphingosinicella sp.]|nr:tetratricopeptide repeat protein [Allosphingosinicella sp.]